VAMLEVTDTTTLDVVVRVLKIGVLRERNGGPHAAGCRQRAAFGRLERGWTAYVTLVDGLAKSWSVDRSYVTVHQTRAVEFTENGQDAASAMHIFHVVVG